MSELIIQSGKLQGKKLVLPPKKMVVGRDDDCDMKIASSLVSRKHCSLTSTADGIVVEDLGSQNGTHVNDVPIDGPTLLKEGDTLRIGAIVLIVPVQPKAKPGTQPVVVPQAKISDADIADWLMDSGSNYAGTDTAEIATYSAPTQSPTPVPPTAPSKAAASKVLTVKDEAAAIIRKHWETVRAKQKG